MAGYIRQVAGQAFRADTEISCVDISWKKSDDSVVIRGTIRQTLRMRALNRSSRQTQAAGSLSRLVGQTR